MNGVSMRHIVAGVVLAGLLVPHWLPVLRVAGDQPLTFVLALGTSAVLAAVWGARGGRPARAR